LKYGDPNGGGEAFDHYAHGIIGFVDNKGIVGFDVFSSAEVRGQFGTGTEMFNGMMKRIAAENVEVTGVRGTWMSGTDSVNYAQYNAGIKAGLTPQQAAANTWTGRLAQEHGFTVVGNVEGKGNVSVVFRKPGSN
jgi:filamentous hemagglutinin